MQSSTPQLFHQQGTERCPVLPWGGNCSSFCLWQLEKGTKYLCNSSAILKNYTGKKKDLGSHERYSTGIWSADSLWSLLTPISNGLPLLYINKYESTMLLWTNWTGVIGTLPCANSLSGVVNTFEDQSKGSLLKGGEKTERLHPYPNNDTGIWMH